MEISEVLERLVSLAEPEYGEFVSKGAPSDYPVIGVRVPRIQELAKEILEDAELTEKILTEFEPKSREEIHLLSLVFAGWTNKNGLDKERFFKIVARFGSWEMVDIFCSRMKCVKKNREEWLFIIDEFLEEGEFFARTGLVLLLDYYVEAEWIQVVFERILRVVYREEYYVKMAVAWLLQKCYVYFPDLTYNFMRVSDIPEWTLRKAVSKIQDSYRVDSSWKKQAKELIDRGDKR